VTGFYNPFPPTEFSKIGDADATPQPLARVVINERRQGAIQPPRSIKRPTPLVSGEESLCVALYGLVINLSRVVSHRSGKRALTGHVLP